MTGPGGDMAPRIFLIFIMLFWGIISCPLPGAIAQESAPSGITASDAVELRAQLRPRLQTILSAPLSARILSLNVEEGSRVVRGATIARLDCADHRAGLKMGEARRVAARATLAASRRLKELGSGSALDLALAEAELSAAEAEISLYSAILDRCEITAPFDGLIASRPAHPFQYVQEGDPLVELLHLDELEVEMVVPASWLTWLTENTPLTFRVDATGQVAEGTVQIIGGRVDPVSQTLRVIGLLATEPGMKLLPGMSGSVIFSERPDTP